MLKRSYSLILFLALLLPILAACGGDTQDGGGTGAQATAAATTGAETGATATTGTTGEATAAPTTGADAGGATQGDAATAGGSGDISKLQVEEGATLRVATWGDPSEQAVNQESFARFNQIFPNVQIVYEPRPSEFQTTMKADMSAGTAPDIFYLDVGLMQAFAPNGLLLELDPAMQQAGVNLDDYLGSLSSLWQHDGKTYALPKDFGAVVLFVNNDMAQAVGVDPASLKTWADLQSAAQKMTQGEGNAKTYGMCVAPDINRVGAFMLQQPGMETLVADNKAVFNSDASVEALQLLYGIYQGGNGATASEIGADWCGQAFGEGKAAMVHEGGWLLPFLKQNAPEVNFTAVPLPLPEGGEQDTLIFTNGWAANANTQYPNAAAALVLFLTSEANQKPIMESGFALPTVASLLEDPFFANNPNERVVAEAGAYGTLADTIYSVEKKDDVIQRLSQAMERVWLGQQDPRGALQQAEQEVNELLGS